MTPPEFSRPERLDAVGTVARELRVAAEADERAGLAKRFGLTAVDALIGVFGVQREPAGVRVRGRVAATVVQACSITGDPVPATVDEAVDLLFVAAPVDGGDEIELSDDTIDVVFHDGVAIDLGETAAETMALALDPFPRGPGAAAALSEAGIKSEGEAGPFGALAALLKKD